jgi:hypothetical protein
MHLPVFPYDAESNRTAQYKNGHDPSLDEYAAAAWRFPRFRP